MTCRTEAGRRHASCVHPVLAAVLGRAWIRILWPGGKPQRLVEKFNDDHVIKLVATVVIANDQNGAVTKHNGRTPGALGAVMAGLVGGIAGLIAGPAVAALGAASGALSGGWFDLLRVQDRESFMNEVARGIGTHHAALLGEVVNPNEDAKRLVEEALAGLGGVLVRNDE